MTHDAALARARSDRAPRWRCLECGVTGIGGADEFTAHWISTHNEPPF